MDSSTVELNSESAGDARAHLGWEALMAGLKKSAPVPRDRGRVELIVRKVDGGKRETPESIAVDPERGLPGDAWGRREGRKLDMQITVMQRNVAELVANGQPLTLFGDNLILDLDLSAANLPIGSQVRIGEVLLEVTPHAHNGCKKFRTRFGDDALRFVSVRELRPRNLRGIYMRVIEAGELRRGETAAVISRPALEQTIREVKPGSPEYAATLELRRVILRKPLGLEFDPQELAHEKHLHHIACYRGAHLAGCLVLVPGPNGNIRMKQVAVASNLQRQGIGLALVEFAENFARQAGYRRMTLHARETAVAFYEKYGYGRVGDAFTEVTLPHWAMEKNLSA